MTPGHLTLFSIYCIECNEKLSNRFKRIVKWGETFE